MPYRPENKRGMRSRKIREQRKLRSAQEQITPMQVRLTSAEERAFKREGTDESGPRDYYRRTLARVRGVRR